MGTALLFSGQYNAKSIARIKEQSYHHQIRTNPLNASSVQGYGHIALQVQDVHKAFDLLLKNGATQVVPPSLAVKKGDLYAYVN